MDHAVGDLLPLVEGIELPSILGVGELAKIASRTTNREFSFTIRILLVGRQACVADVFNELACSALVVQEHHSTGELTGHRLAGIEWIVSTNTAHVGTS